MLKRYLLTGIVLWAKIGIAQYSGLESEFEGIPVGGKEQIEQVLQTQLTLPKILLTPNFNEHVTAFFDLDSVGNAINITFKDGLNNALRKETLRLLHFLKFKRTQSAGFETYPYYLSYHISTERYNKLFKQKNRLVFKKPFPADSSYILYSKADRSPEYYKNGDEGLAEFILSEISYPDVAIEKSIEGTVILEFAVETNGYVTGITVRQGVNGGCTEEAIRLIKLTKWQPAVLNNKFVRYKTVYPITFSLRNLSTNGPARSMGQ
jgi:TonB family protein